MTDPFTAGHATVTSERLDPLRTGAGGIDHVLLKVKDYHASKAFYLAALGPLGYVMLKEIPDGRIGGMGPRGKPDFWIHQGEQSSGPVHLAFAAPDTKHVDDFYKAALDHGAVDNGAPGMRPQYHPGYYGAFVLDPDGNNIEAVCHLAHPSLTNA